MTGRAGVTECKRGHEFTPENTYVNKRGSRVCRACQSARPRGPRLEYRACSVEGCDGIYQAKGLCRIHYSRVKRTGTVDAKPLIEDHFWDHVDNGEPDECWLWQGSISDAGYGRIGKRYAHRISCERAHGPAPFDEAVVQHACDNPPCVNPAHLAWGTQSQNVADAYRRGRR